MSCGIRLSVTLLLSSWSMRSSLSLLVFGVVVYLEKKSGFIAYILKYRIRQKPTATTTAAAVETGYVFVWGASASKLSSSSSPCVS